MSVNEATLYHSEQVDAFAETEADMISACTINYIEEAVGIAIAAKSSGMPLVISFTVETNGDLPSGEFLKSAIEKTDILTNRYPSYYMINCAHPTHFMGSLIPDGDWLTRLRGIRPNASTKSHAELNENLTLDDGDPIELASHFKNLLRKLPALTVCGGCCGTDIRHLEEICKSILS